MTLSYTITSRPFRASLLFPLLLLLAACGSSPQEGAQDADKAVDSKHNDALAGAPDWVKLDCRSHFAEDKAVLCGVGSVSGVSSPSLARNTAMARGRTEISRYLSIDVKSVITDYQAAKGGATEQDIEDQSQQISEMTLSGSRMASYFQGQDGTYYALMVLELDAFKQSVEASASIDQALKEALISNAAKSFSVRDSETSRY